MLSLGALCVIGNVFSLIVGVSQSQDGKGFVRNTMDTDDHAKVWISNTGLLRFLSFFCLGVKDFMLSFGLCN